MEQRHPRAGLLAHSNFAEAVGISKSARCRGLSLQSCMQSAVARRPFPHTAEIVLGFLRGSRGREAQPRHAWMKKMVANSSGLVHRNVDRARCGRPRRMLAVTAKNKERVCHATLEDGPHVASKQRARSRSHEQCCVTLATFIFGEQHGADNDDDVARHVMTFGKPARRCCFFQKARLPCSKL